MQESPPVEQRGGGAHTQRQGLLFWLLNGGFKVSSGTAKWYRNSYGTDFDNSEIASPLHMFDKLQPYGRV